MLNYVIFTLLIIISYFSSYFINKKLHNFDIPGDEKIHKKNVITSGGLIPFFLVSLIIFYLIYFKEYNSNFYNNIPQIWLAPVCILIFTTISFLDDLNYIPFQIRLIAQIIVVYFCISLFPVNYDFNFQTPIFNGFFPVKVDIIFTIFFWTFLINSTNFIDGYDGMYSFQITTNFIGLSIIFSLLGENFHFYVSILMVLIGLIFIPFNLSNKYKLFIGDAGSIPSGFILGWMIISLINMGHLISALLLNLFFLADISFTLIDRILKKKSIFKRHNDFVFKKIIFKYGPKKYFLTAFIFQILMVSGSILMVIF
jgi:UDP-N-acetylmuramyl pentapeptide phosphotransferase/UDP-N-acetylglucosamine-1-phosphate transferase|tara:strand:- start:175 stop:1110 length:936 start_codon:yes stop_codon:yes gene_type:complete